MEIRVPRRIITERGLDRTINYGDPYGRAIHTSHRDGTRVMGVLGVRTSNCKEATESNRVIETGDIIEPRGFGCSMHRYRVELRDKESKGKYVMTHITSDINRGQGEAF